MECIAGCHVGEGKGGVSAGFDDEAVGAVRVFPRRVGEDGWDSAAEFGVEVRVDCLEDVGGPVGEVAVVLSGRVILCRVEEARLGGRKPLLIFKWRWEDFGQAS
jgi:hypothetical protein